jgi:hypothetical protein
MNNNLLQIKIKQRLNKLASFDYDNLECWMVQEAFNKAQIEWVRRMMYGLNQRREGTEISTGLTDDLRVIMKSVPLTSTNRTDYYDATIPADYLYYVRVDVYAKSKCCPDKRKMVVYEAEEANMGVLLTSNTKGPSFEWGETLSTLVGDKIRVYTNNEFEITDMALTYMRLPRPVQFLGCVNPSTGTAFTANQECEFKDDIAEIMVDAAAAILAGDIESMNQYQRESQEVIKNS